MRPLQLELWIVGLILVFLSGCQDPDDDDSSTAPSSPTPEVTAPALRVDGDSIDFGEVALEETSMVTREVGNDGSAALSLSQTILPVTPEGTDAFWLTGADGGEVPAVVEPGGTVLIELWFAPAEAVHHEGTWVLETNDENHPLVEVALSGSGYEAVVDKDEDGYPEGEDCDDEDPLVNPGVDELCDGRDNDCDLEVDEGALSSYYEDSDGDGFGDPEAGAFACTAPDGYVDDANDCDDQDPGLHPDALEVCDDVDNDCDGEVDEEVRIEFFVDADEDGAGDAANSVMACTAPEGYVAFGDDCDDAHAEAHPSAEEICDLLDNDCDGGVDEAVTTPFYRDEDGDDFGQARDAGDDSVLEACEPPEGYVPLSGDCDDGDDDVYPSAIEACDGKDNDCDTLIDEEGETPFYVDVDGDDHGDPLVSEVGCNPGDGYVAEGDDCDDRDPAVYPGADEACNGRDDNCNDEVDEGALNTFYLDADHDSYGDDLPLKSCQPPDDRYVEETGDCNDLDPLAYPGADERCNLEDDDCDGEVDEGDIKTTFFADADDDGFGDPGETRAACEPPEGYVANDQDCDDGDSNVHPGAVEVCDGVDNDCDWSGGADGQPEGGVDEGVENTYYGDGDGDGYGVTGATIQACEVPDGYAEDPGDCDDSDGAVHPGAEETCNGRDDDCDGEVDEDGDAMFYFDGDNDSYGDALVTILACEVPDGYAENGDDCDDRNPGVHPGAEETCNGLDDDCDDGAPDGGVDEGVTTTWYLDADQDGFGDADADLEACSAPGDRYVVSAGDCNDLSSSINPDADEVCNGVDDNCDSVTDEGFDGDEDGTADCIDDDLDGWNELDGDCDDTRDDVYPGAEEIGSDGIDNDCDGQDDTEVVIDFETYPNGNAVPTGAAILQQYEDWGVYFRTDGTTTVSPTIRTNSGTGFSQPTSGVNVLGSDSVNSAGLVAYFVPELYVTRVSIRDTDDDCTYKILYAFDELGEIIDQMRSDGTCHAGGPRPTLTVEPVDDGGEPMPIARVEFDTQPGPSGGSYDGTYFTIDDFSYVYNIRLEEMERTRVIDFEFGADGVKLSQGTALINQYAGWGAQFSTDGTTTAPATIRSFVGTGFQRPSSGENALGSDSQNSAGLVVTFNEDLFVTRVSIRDVDDDSTVKTLFAFDADGNVVASDQSNGTADPGAPLPLIQVAPVGGDGAAIRIYSVEFDTQPGDAGGSNDGTYFTIDDLSFTYF